MKSPVLVTTLAHKNKLSLLIPRSRSTPLCYLMLKRARALCASPQFLVIYKKRVLQEKRALEICARSFL